MVRLLNYRRHAITWMNVYQDHRRRAASPGHNELRHISWCHYYDICLLFCLLYSKPSKHSKCATKRVAPSLHIAWCTSRWTPVTTTYSSISGGLHMTLLNDYFVTLSCTWICRFKTYWGRDTHICVRKLTTIDSDNGLSPGRRQTIIWANVAILLSGILCTTFSEISS